MIEMIVLTMAMAAMPQASETPDTSVTVLSLEDAIRIALSENASVRVADKEIERVGYAKKGTYASLLPQIDGTGSFQRTIKKQVMYMDVDMSKLGLSGGSASGSTTGTTTGTTVEEGSSKDGFQVGRLNNWSIGAMASMPLVNAQLWKSLKISGEEVDLAVEKARGSRLETVTQVKNAYYAVLLAKEAFNVYKNVYENSLQNCELTQKKYNAGKASELDLTRAKANLASAVPSVYDSESAVILALWQLKAIMGVDLDMNIDLSGALMDYAEGMMRDGVREEGLDLTDNSQMRQLAIQAEELADKVKMDQYAYIPSLSLAFSAALNASNNDFRFNEYQWNPYSYVGLSLNIPIFSSGKRQNAVRQSKVQAAQLDIQRTDAERQLKIAIRQYLNAMETAMKSYASAEDALATAQKAYDIAVKSYNVGRSTLTDLNDAQLVLVQTQLTVCQAVHTFMTSKAELEQIIGKDITE